MSSYQSPLPQNANLRSLLSSHVDSFFSVFSPFAEVSIFYVGLFVLLHNGWSQNLSASGILSVWLTHMCLLSLLWCHSHFSDADKSNPVLGEESNNDDVYYSYSDEHTSLEEHFRYMLLAQRNLDTQQTGYADLGRLHINALGDHVSALLTMEHDVEWWAHDFLEDIHSDYPPSPPFSRTPSPSIIEESDSSILVSNGQVTAVFQDIPEGIPRPSHPEFTISENLPPSYYSDPPQPDHFFLWINPTFSTDRMPAHFYGYEHMYVESPIANELTNVNLEMFTSIPRRITHGEFLGLLDADFFFPVGVKLWTFERPSFPRSRFAALKLAYPTYQIQYETRGTNGIPTLSIANTRGAFFGVRTLSTMLFAERYWNERSVHDLLREELESRLPPIHYRV